MLRNQSAKCLLFCALLNGLFTTCAFAKLLSTFPAGKNGWELGTIAVGDIDGDPSAEIIVPYRDSTGAATEWFLDAFKPDGRRVNGFPFRGGTAPINVSPTLYDLTGDGRNEILFTQGNQVVALRGDGTVLWSSRVWHENYVPNAGYQVVTNGFYWSWDEAWRDRLPATAEFSSEVSPPIVADLDGTGKLKVVTAWKIDPDKTSTAQDYNPFIKQLFGFGEWGTVGDVWSGGAVFFDADTGRQDFIYHFYQLVESGIALGRPRSKAAPLVYVLNDSDSVVAFDKTAPYGLWGKGMLHKQFGKNQRLQSGSYLKGVDIYTADLDGDGEDELLVPTSQLDPLWQPCETILDDDGAVLWRRWMEESKFPVAHGWLNSACMIPVNPDRDNRVDVLSFTHSHQISFRTWDGVKLVDRPGWPKDFYPFIPTPPVVGDVDGDGAEEVVIGTYHPGATPSHGKLHVFRLDGVEKFSIAVPGGLKHIPALADVDGDSAIEVVYRSLAGTISIHHFGAKPGGAVSWATHRGNMRRDGHRGTTLFPEGTPLITSKTAGYRRATFSWRIPPGRDPSTIRIFRAEDATGPFQHIISLPPSRDSFTDEGLKDGWQYFYEVRAVYDGQMVGSAPFAITPFVNQNLVANGAFEEDDDSRWDKWFTGAIPWQNMTGSDEMPHQGRQSMQIRLENHGSNSSIKQGNQYGIPDPAIRTEAGRFYSFGGFLRGAGLSEPSEHWLEWNTTRTGENTNAIPKAPWPSYFTPPLELGPDPTEWIYANRVFLMPEGFPNIELRHRFVTEKPTTGSVFIDSVFFREIPLPADERWTELIPFGAHWLYSHQSPPENWHSESFDTTGWGEGRAKFGGGTGPKNVVTPLPLKKPAYYFRHTFSLEDLSFDELLLAATATDHANGVLHPLSVYLNGVELVSSGIDIVSGAGNTVRYFDLFPFLDLLRPGENTIAVLVRNAWASDWDNVAFDLSLRAIRAPERTRAGPAFTSISRQADGSVTLQVIGPPGTAWTVECSNEPQNSGSWQPIQSIHLTSPEGVTVRDEGQNGVSHPQESGVRFYRAVPQ